MARSVELKDIEKEYGKLAKEYEERHWNFLNIPHYWVLSQLDRPRNIIDLGCGTGRLPGMIRNRFTDVKVKGIDCSGDMLTIANTRIGDGDFYVGDIENMELPKGFFDTVLSINVLHHLNNPEAHFDLLTSLCDRGGAIYLCDYAIETPKLRWAEKFWRIFKFSHRYGYTVAELKELLEKRFTIEAHDVLQPDQFWRLQIYKLRPLSHA